MSLQHVAACHCAKNGCDLLLPVNNPLAAGIRVSDLQKGGKDFHFKRWGIRRNPSRQPSSLDRHGFLPLSSLRSALVQTSIAARFSAMYPYLS